MSTKRQRTLRTARLLSRAKWALLVIFILIPLESEAQSNGNAPSNGYIPISRGCDERSCYPATGNLLIGRQDKLSSTSTCGSERKERYCILSHLDYSKKSEKSGKKCFWCDSTDEGKSLNPRTSHKIENIVYRMEPPDKPGPEQYRTWWQAKNGQENVTIQLDLEAEFHVTHLIITFKTFRPAAMYVERSYDWGETWKIYRYFAADCERTYPGIKVGVPSSLDEIVCMPRYSRVTPSTLGTVIYRVLPPNINIHSPSFNPYSREVQDLLKTTNLRIHLQNLHTMGDENLETDRADIKEKYYFSIYDMTVRGSCSCYGHAQRCLPEIPEHTNITGMVHGTCDCQHNTMGNNCEYCMDMFHDAPWRPAVGKKYNECKKCECNEHATKCYFSPYLYEATGNRTGGVCDNCMHNTEGTHCESCLEGFYQDPALDIQDPEICKPCDCEPEGTVDDGLCDGKTDEEEGTVAGQCHCKTYVGGQRCDRCLNGFWNFTLENPDGCQECQCDIRGILSSDGCDQETGACTCKRNVIGRDCDQCRPEHYGLSLDDEQGCKACECDIGGSWDNNCDIITGQCKCRPNIEGRRCDNIIDGYYTGPLDFLIFEGELAQGSRNPVTKVIRREPSREPNGTTWTGFGFMQTFEDSTLTFDAPALFKDLEYDLIVRYEHMPNFPNQYEDVKVELIRIDGNVSADGNCANVTYGDGPTSFPLPNSKQKHTIAPDPLCLEEGARYQIKFTIDQYDVNNPDSKSSILIDSIALIPKIDSLPIWNATGGEEVKEVFDELNCRSYFLTVPRGDVPKNCTDALNSISYFTFDGGLNKPCECDPTGSESTLCDKYTGECPCKKNVVGRRCDRCAPGTYGFSSEGCKPCDCHNQGSLDPFCRETDGQCRCAENAFGRRCNECQAGFWDFPDCKPCECNGHAPTCDAESGECIDCRDWTDGVHCEICLDGYYGDPTLEVNIPCRECPCPNSKASGHSFADICYLDTTNNEPVCECEEGYTGTRCDMCADNFYGNPEIPGGSCNNCNCSDNWNFEDTGNCDPHSGSCLKCIFNTEGDHCEYCKPGFYGDAIEDMCKDCKCNMLGTDPVTLVNEQELALSEKDFACDRFSGKCQCLPNVIGDECDECKENHWKIASGEGCEACDCDPVGSTSESCNLYDGQCECKDGFGGRKCDQCEENYWGDPREQCYPCDCNPQGSQSFQCDWKTGACVCLEGIGGEKCDECAVGFVQEGELTPETPVLDRKIEHDEMPACIECGECFTNWNRILTELKNATELKVLKANQVKMTGVTGAYSYAFDELETMLTEVKEILKSGSITNDELRGVQSEIDRISFSLKQTTDSLDELDAELGDNQQSILQGSSNLDFLRSESDNLKLNAQDMKDQITRLQEANVEGALNLTREAKRRSEEAALQVQGIEAAGGMLALSETRRKQTTKTIDSSKDQFDETQSDNQQKLDEVLAQIDNLEGKIPDLNKKVCDGTTSVAEPCDELCGGAGCNQCGGISCLKGALSKAEDSVKSATAADDMLLEKDRKAAQVLREITKAQQKAETAAEEAQKAYDLASEAKNRSLGEMERVDALTENIDSYMTDDKATPEQVQDLAEQCMAATMDLDSSAITGLSVEINEAIGSVTDVDKILTETSDDIAKAEQLKADADRSKAEATAQLEHARKVTTELSEAMEAQNRADTAIQSAQEDIDAARKDLSQISNRMDEAILSSDRSVSDVRDLSARQQSLQTGFIMNENRVNSARDAAVAAKDLASSANAELYQLNAEFKNVSSSLEVKTNDIGRAKDLAVDLQRRANELATSASNKMANIYDVEKEYEETERRLMELSSELVSLNCEMMIHLQVIEDKSNYYRTCASGSEWQPTAACQCLPGTPEPQCVSRREVYYEDR